MALPRTSPLRTKPILTNPNFTLPLALLALIALLGVPQKAAAVTCPEGICPCNASTQWDVVDWMVGTQFESNTQGYMANTGGQSSTPIYPTLWPQTSTVQGKIWYSKGKISNGTEGYAWDVNTYDSSNVYFALTNPAGAWNFPNYRQYADPQTTNGFYPIAPRCISKTGTGKLFDYSIPHSPTDESQYFAVNDCVVQPTQYLGGADMQLWAPTTYSGLPSPMNGWTLISLLYNYGWNTSANNWNAVEKFYFSQTYGWVAWEQWNLVNGTYVKENSAYMGQYEATGNVPPAQPGCS